MFHPETPPPPLPKSPTDAKVLMLCTPGGLSDVLPVHNEHHLHIGRQPRREAISSTHICEIFHPCAFPHIWQWGWNKMLSAIQLYPSIQLLLCCFLNHPPPSTLLRRREPNKKGQHHSTLRFRLCVGGVLMQFWKRFVGMQ